MFKNIQTNKKKALIGMICIGLISGCFFLSSNKPPTEPKTDKVAPTEVAEVPEINNQIVFNGENYQKIPDEAIEEEEVEEGSATEKLINLQKELEAIDKEKKALESKLLVSQNEIRTYSEAMEKNDIMQGNTLSVIDRYLRNFYMAESNYSLPLNVLNTTNFEDFLINYNLQQEFVSRLKHKAEKLVKDNEELSKNKDLLENETNLYMVALVDLEEKNASLKAKQEELQNVLWDNRYALSEEELIVASRIAARISRSKYKYDSNHSGKFMRAPTYGPITSTWGDRVHPIFGVEKHHAGVDIGVDFNTPIVAAAGGVVIMSSWYGGYGKTIMIDHGKGIVSLYGHNSSLLVKEGDIVRGGQPVALSGSTGNSTGPHCHFEVRENGQDIDPYTYVIE